MNKVGKGLLGWAAGASISIAALEVGQVLEYDRFCKHYHFDGLCSIRRCFVGWQKVLVHPYAACQVRGAHDVFVVNFDMVEDYEGEAINAHESLQPEKQPEQELTTREPNS